MNLINVIVLRIPGKEPVSRQSLPIFVFGGVVEHEHHAHRIVTWNLCRDVGRKLKRPVRGYLGLKFKNFHDRTSKTRVSFPVTVHESPPAYPGLGVKSRLSLCESGDTFAERKATMEARERLPFPLGVTTPIVP